MTFKTRNEAENVRHFALDSTRFKSHGSKTNESQKNSGIFVSQAANLGAKFKGRLLQISWYKPKMPLVTTEPEDDEAKDEENRVRHILRDYMSALKPGRELTIGPEILVG